MKSSTARPLTLELDPGDDDRALREVAAHYHDTLLVTDHALAWLERRGIGLDAVCHFRLGFADRTLGLRLPQKNRKAGAAVRAQLLRLGVLRETGHERLGGCVVVPLIDAERWIVDLCGHRIGEPGQPVWLRDAPRGVLDPGECAPESLATSRSCIEALLGSCSSSTDPEPPAHTPSDDSLPPTAADEIVLVFDDRRWRIRGLAANKGRGTLRINLLVSRATVGFHLDVLDLCSARHRAAFAHMAADELRTDEARIRKDLGQVLLALEHAQDELLRRAHEPATTVPTMTDAQREAALALLTTPRLLDRILDDLAQLGVVGERNNLLLAYLAALSRKLSDPLAIVVQSSSAAGKSSLLAAVLSLVPDEDRVAYSAMTGRATPSNCCSRTVHSRSPAPARIPGPGAWSRRSTASRARSRS